jgi:hypothetical protein
LATIGSKKRGNPSLSTKAWADQGVFYSWETER